MRGLPEEELIARGHRACAGCGSILALRYAMKALGERTIVVTATGCMEVVTSPYPETSWRVPWIHVAFENAAAVASGIARALKVRGKTDVKVVAIAGDGGTADIGIQALSGAAERNENIIYICYDNEAYENTGIQRSGCTPFGAWTTTTPVGKVMRGEDRPKKDMPAIMAAHGIPYVATASIAYPLDLIKKVKKARDIEGTSYIHVHASCVPGWRIPENKSVEICKLAVLSGVWVLYE
ncbi:MAG: thiamine pyrophosphate-dependent enzyme, partial [Syntrophales bacterium]|nr:thiamine pyrophosphate-dependent enzyme [Syntrophales bacterium]